MKSFKALIVLSAIFLQSNASFAAPKEPGCYQNLLNSIKYREPIGKQKECFLSSEGFAQAIAVLCSEDQNKLSDNYIQYLNAGERMQKAIEDFQIATDKAGRDLAYKNLFDAKKENEKYGNVLSARFRFTDALEVCLLK